MLDGTEIQRRPFSLGNRGDTIDRTTNASKIEESGSLGQPRQDNRSRLQQSDAMYSSCSAVTFGWMQSSVIKLAIGETMDRRTFDPGKGGSREVQRIVEEEAVTLMDLIW